jgi:hypothetical protein
MVTAEGASVIRTKVPITRPVVWAQAGERNWTSESQWVNPSRS